MKKNEKEQLKKSVTANLTLTLTPKEIHDKIQKKALELYRKRREQGKTGSDWDDWFEAERIVKTELKNT